MTSTSPQPDGITIIIPAFNEEGALGNTLSELKKASAAIGGPIEIIVVDDGSSDQTSATAEKSQVTVIRHPINSGYGRSLLSGIEAARHNTIAIVDADGTYPVAQLPDLVAFYRRGFHMAVAARQGSHYHSSIGKRLLRAIFRWLAEFTCGRNIPDINSGFRIFDRRPVLAWRGSLSTGFSFTTTITLLFMLNHLFVGYLPMTYSKRIGASKVRLFRDSLRSLQIIITTIAQYNPLKLFLLLLFVNAFGNILLSLFSFIQEWPPALATFSLVAWNTSSLLAALAILALTLVKPTSTSDVF